MYNTTIVAEPGTLVVIDASAVLAVVLSEPERNALIAATDGAVLVAPASLPWEVGNGLVAAVRRRRLSVRDAIRAWDSYDRIAVRFADINVREALRLAVKRGLYAYDAYVLALAQDRRLPLLTLDQPLRRAAAATGIALWEF